MSDEVFVNKLNEAMHNPPRHSFGNLSDMFLPSFIKTKEF
jgi:hypothetical protein